MSNKKYFCYLIRCDRYIKIGYTNNLDRRFESLQTGNPIELELLEAFIHETAEAAENNETKLHHRFRKHHVRGEWFKARPILKYIANRKKPRWIWLWLL